MATSSSSYYGTGTKTLQSFDNFAGGMYYTSKELPEGYSKTVLNFKHSSDGTILSQRPGIHHIPEMNDPELRSAKLDIATHFLRHNEYDVYISLGGNFNNLVVYLHHRENHHVEKPTVEKKGISNITFKTKTMSYTEVDKYPMHRPIWTPYIPNDSIILLATWTEDGKEKEGMLELWYNVKENKMVLEPVTAKQPDAQEAISYGFNALSEEPMTFTDDEASASFNPDVIIPYKYDTSKPRNLGDIRLEAVQGEKIAFKLHYSCKSHKDYKVKWEYQGEGSETWEVKQDFTSIGATDNGDILVIIPQDKVFSLKVTMKDNTVKDDPDTEPDESLALAKAITYPRYRVTTEGKDYSTMMELDLFKADNVLYYNRQMVLYGKTVGEPNTLFFSDFEDPSYFPYPLKTISFDENITHVHVLGQKLVVFTSNRMYILADSILPDEMGVYLLKDDLSINEMDRHTVRSIGTSLYFTVGNQFYLATANKYTEDPGNMTVTKISERIDYLLDDLEMSKFLATRYGEEDARFKKATPLYKFSYLDKQMVKTYIGYELVTKTLRWQGDEPTEDDYDVHTYIHTLVINYDTQLRTWELEEVRNSLVYFCYRDNINENIRIVSGSHHYNELAEYDKEYFYDDLHNGTGQAIELFLDTGVRAMDPYRKKRFKLFSLQLHNIDETEMAIKFEFRIDGQTRQSFRDYQMIWHEDPESPKYGTIEWTYEEDYNMHAPGATYLDKWKLDLSRFAGVERVKLNHRISGQGYFPQAIIKGAADRPFEFLGYGFVYKPKKMK